MTDSDAGTRLHLSLPARAAGAAAAAVRDREPQGGRTAAAQRIARALAQRLAIAKAEAVARLHPGAWVIGADQVAECDDDILGKPGTPERARMQLAVCSGRVVTFHTAVRLMRGSDAHTHVDVTRVKFRVLGTEEIERYVELDNPLDCAGSFRSEGLGIVLFERVETDDPTALVGLPLLWLAGVLRKVGFDPLTAPPTCI
jgi:septum formation protein